MTTSSRPIFHLVWAIVIASGPLAIEPAFAGHAVVSCGDGTTWDDSCSGGGGGSSGPTYVAPAPSGPSPAEIARRRRLQAAHKANIKGLAASDRSDWVAAVRYFEDARRLSPGDPYIQGNYWYAKGSLLAFTHKDYRGALKCFNTALRFEPNNKTILASIAGFKVMRAGENVTTAEARHDWDLAIQLDRRINGSDARENRMHYFLGRMALDKGNWDVAVRELHEYETLTRAKARKYPQYFKSELVTIRKYLELALAHQREAQKSNPNYPKPPPVYRDASTPRSYPKLDSYTKAQRTAHAENETGNLMAQKGDWVQAMLAYQQALMEDPNGPFTDVIKRNLDLARSHLGPAKKAAAAAPAAAPAPADSTTLVRQSEPLKTVAAPNCTGWMAQTDGSSYRLCMDEKAQHYCEQAKAGAVSRVACP